MHKKRVARAVKRSERIGCIHVCELLATDAQFTKLLDTHAQINDLNDVIQEKSQIVNYKLRPNKGNYLQFIHSWLGSLQTTTKNLNPSLQTLRDAVRSYFNDSKVQQRRRQRLANSIGLNAARNSQQEVKVIRLRRLTLPYPPPKHNILERDHPIPEKPELYDYTCGYCTDFHIINEDQLSYTLPMTESAIFVDEQTNKIIAVVLRNFAKDGFRWIKPWATSLLRDTVQRRYKSQRNGQGDLVRFGVSDGPRHKRIFGWVRNLKQKYQRGNDRKEHDTALSSLFGFFYSLFRAQMPEEIVMAFENAIAKSNLPRLDFEGSGSFTLPLNPPLTFRAHPMAPPEGYIGINFAKNIHKDTHWNDCPYGCYWNISREQGQNQKVGIESGGNFFIADYGLRIANSENVCVSWQVSMWHGTSWYYDGLRHIGLAFLLTRSTERAWAKYDECLNKKKFVDGELMTDVDLSEDEVEDQTE